MPVNQTLGDIVKLGDMPLEQKEQIADSIIYNAKHKGEFYTQVNNRKLDQNKTSMTFIRSYLPEIDKTSDRYTNGLIEGVTPDPETLNEAEFSVHVTENGWYYTFTNKALNHSWHDTKTRCTNFLGNLFRTYHDEKIADAYLSSANIITGASLIEYKDLLRIATILRKNHAQKINGYYILRVASEVADAMLLTYKELFTHTTQKENVIEGEIGEIAGFRVIVSTLQAFEESGSNYPFVAYGLNEKGDYPVSKVSYDNMAEKIILTPLGGLGNDPLHQRGSIGLYLDGHGFYVEDDSVCVRGTMASSAITSASSSATLSHEKDGKKFVFDEAYASNKTGSNLVRRITPEYDYVKINRYSASTTANTLTLKAKKEDGTDWTFGTGTGKVTAVSGNTSVATISGATLTTAGVGVTTVVITENDNANNKTIITVEVLNGTGTGVVA